MKHSLVRSRTPRRLNFFHFLPTMLARTFWEMIAINRGLVYRQRTMHDDQHSDDKPAGGELASELLPVVYRELRSLAANLLNREPPGQTLQPTALVHEAFVRVVGRVDSPKWENRGHFFAAAARAMRRILV